MVVFFSLLFAAQSFALESVVPKAYTNYWNEIEVQEANNCYNYSTNRRTDNFAQPGQAAGGIYSNISCREVYAAAIRDGLTPTEYFPYRSKSDEMLIALVAVSGWDYHWYRRDDNGYWTHKIGSSEATDLDSSGNRISNPETADRGEYKDFCGYFKIKNFPHDETEQNAGYVRIGDMKELPGTLPGTVTRSLFSGRPNPEFMLSDLLKKKEFREMVEGIASQKYLAAVVDESENKEFSKLGNQGILIHDRTGLVFSPGTKVFIKDGRALVYTQGQKHPYRVQTGD